MADSQIEARLDTLARRGVTIVDPRQTYIAPDVELDHVCPGVTLYPGSQLYGERTLIGPNASIGREGPAVLRDTVLGPRAVVASGYLEGAVLLEGATAGWGAHFRPGTLLEEDASTAHAVGLKHTILLSFVTLGSLINFCDCLMSGGTSRKDHSEVGSGFIHFNYTPWGRHGDKATPSLIGDVGHGVFLRSPRVFLGGSGGLVGPGRVGFGSVTGAGQVVRQPVDEHHLFLQPTPSIDTEFKPGRCDAVEPRLTVNIDYVRQLVALRCWYQQVRLKRVPETDPVGHLVIEAAIETIGLCIEERVRRLVAFAVERGQKAPTLNLEPYIPCPLECRGEPVQHVTWVQGLSIEAVEQGMEWLHSIMAQVTPTT